MNHIRRTLNRRVCAAGFAAVSSLIGTALAAEIPLRELPDGSLVPREDLHGVVVHARYTHQAKLVASNCLSLESRRVGIRTIVPQLVNTCAYATSFSYCIDGADADTSTCDTVGHRKAESYRVEPRARFAIRDDEAVTDAYVDWVACRADANTNAISTLIADGTRGECLGADGNVQTASLRTREVE